MAWLNGRDVELGVVLSADDTGTTVQFGPDAHPCVVQLPPLGFTRGQFVVLDMETGQLTLDPSRAWHPSHKL